MLNTESPRQFKQAAYGGLADVTKALGSPRRLELVDLLVQGPRPVESLARATAQPIASASQHLQVLKRARLVETERQGTTIEYRLAPGVAGVLVALRRLAHARSAELRETTDSFFEDTGTIDRERLTALLREGAAMLVDVRPTAEYEQAHLPGARSIPVETLAERLAELPADRLIVACCRGPYCTFAGDAVRLLQARGFRAARFEDGVAEWSADGGTLEAAQP